MKRLVFLPLLLIAQVVLLQTPVVGQNRMPTHPVSLEVYGQARYGYTKGPAANTPSTSEILQATLPKESWVGPQIFSNVKFRGIYESPYWCIVRLRDSNEAG